MAILFHFYDVFAEIILKAIPEGGNYVINKLSTIVILGSVKIDTAAFMNIHYRNIILKFMVQLK